MDENVGMVEGEDGEVKTGEREEGRLPAENEDSLQNAEIRAEVHFRNYDTRCRYSSKYMYIGKVHVPWGTLESG